MQSIQKKYPSKGAAPRVLWTTDSPRVQNSLINLHHLRQLKKTL